MCVYSVRDLPAVPPKDFFGYWKSGVRGELQGRWDAVGEVEGNFVGTQILRGR
jgi:hypothetical protein